MDETKNLLPNDLPALFPSLPNEVSAQILNFVPISDHSGLKFVSKSWNFFISSKQFMSLRKTQIPISQRSHFICFFPYNLSGSAPVLFNPNTRGWRTLPVIPPIPNLSNVSGWRNFTAISVDTDLYVLGGLLVKSQRWKMNVSVATGSAFKYDLLNMNSNSSSWDVLTSMLTARESFACAAIPGLRKLIVAGGGGGGGYMYNMADNPGNRVFKAEIYDIEKDEWSALPHLPGRRAGCTGAMIKNGEDREFWVMGGYAGLTPAGGSCVDDYYNDALVMNATNGGDWVLVEDMLAEGERVKLGKIDVVDDYGEGHPVIFMLNGHNIFRYDMAFNRWQKETSVPERAQGGASLGFIAVGGELYVITGADNNSTMIVEVYDPSKKAWTFFRINLPCNIQIDFATAVLCSVRL